MNIVPVSLSENRKNQNFTAKVNIKSNPLLLDGKAVEELREIGKTIGDNNTQIDMFVGFVKDNPYAYNFSHKTEFKVAENFKTEKITFETNEDIITPTITPLEYGKNLLKRVRQFINKNTIMQ